MSFSSEVVGVSDGITHKLWFAILLFLVASIHLAVKLGEGFSLFFALLHTADQQMSKSHCILLEVLG